MSFSSYKISCQGGIQFINAEQYLELIDSADCELQECVGQQKQVVLATENRIFSSIKFICGNGIISQQRFTNFNKAAAEGHGMAFSVVYHSRKMLEYGASRCVACVACSSATALMRGALPSDEMGKVSSDLQRHRKREPIAVLLPSERGANEVLRKRCDIFEEELYKSRDEELHEHMLGPQETRHQTLVKIPPVTTERALAGGSLPLRRRMDDEEEDMSQPISQLWGSSFRDIKYEDQARPIAAGQALAAVTAAVPASQSHNNNSIGINMPPCSLHWQPRIPFHGSAGLRSHFPAQFEPMEDRGERQNEEEEEEAEGRGEEDERMAERAEEHAGVSVEAQIGRKLREIGDKFQQDHVELLFSALDSSQTAAIELAMMFTLFRSRLHIVVLLMQRLYDDDQTTIPPGATRGARKLSVVLFE
ncbi:hypothetical protein F2P81_024134 [Scophthalmus maximus]|uniref:Uncharacterized protein n=1 Tax=Scophthalmus maximus TaxID=52904 RepID=A0A6A4RYM0_SCOMX|nr:hypothetical protein F2P81_024134 [Scophthalmus maximus]